MPKVIEDEKVFEATVKIFIMRGYEKTTVQDIAQEANVHEATLYRKYGSKVNLIEKAIAYRLSDTPLDKISYSGDLQADLIMIVQAHIETHISQADVLSALLAEVSLHGELRNTLEKPLAHIASVANILSQYQDQGLLKKESPLTTVGVLLGPIIIRSMFERALGGVPLLFPDPPEYVDHFLSGKGTGFSAGENPK